MTNRLHSLLVLGFCLPLGPVSAADEPAPAAKPQPVPVTRQDMKQALENSKRAVPRLPLPPVSEEDRKRAEEAAKARAAEPAKDGQGERARGFGFGIVNNGRMRNYYLSDYNAGGPNRTPGAPSGTGGAGGFPGGRGGDSSFDYPFQTMLFWIVSRGNNCTYCMGHQESKLASAGLSDDRIAALDGTWTEFDPAQRAAFTFAKKLTYEPNAINDADIQALKAHYNDTQITEILLAVAGFNAMNRWTGSLRIPQEERHVFLKPTSPKYESVTSQVAPVGSADSGFVAPAPRVRPALESRQEVEAALEAARQRKPRLTIADESATKAALNGQAGDKPPQWMRLLAVLPKSAPGRVASHIANEQKGTLDARTKAIIFWVTARNDRAWYALGHARKRLQALGFSDDQIFALDRPESLESAADREVVRFATTLAVDPAMMTDDDFTRIRKHFDDKKTAEIVHQVTQAASFDRITEPAGLRLED